MVQSQTQVSITPHQACYYAHELTRRKASTSPDRLSWSLFDACVDLNPHQIEAALFALRSPISKGVVLADEVGLGKTIEAGLVLCQYWAEQRRKLLVICPASLRKQWSLELFEKFNLPSLILDAPTYHQLVRMGNPNPLLQEKVIITSFNYASALCESVQLVNWDLVVVDESHKLRNVYRSSNKMGRNIQQAIGDRRKILLTATPLQNSLLELYGLSTLVDEHIFGDLAAFRSQYTHQNGNLKELKERLAYFCKRTLRSEVVEYVPFTERKLITKPFKPNDREHELYEAVSNFLKREDTFSIPKNQRHLTSLIIMKLLASSSYAIAGTLETLKSRIEAIQKLSDSGEKDLTDQLINLEDIDEEYLDELFTQETETEEDTTPLLPKDIDTKKLNDEIQELDHYIHWAQSIGIDTKTRTLVSALEIGFSEMERMGANRKALIFTESRRTQDYLKQFLDANGYLGQIVQFNGSNTSPETRKIYNDWLEQNKGNGRASNSRIVDTRTALVEYFRDTASIMIATEAAAEGVNLQFCSLVINYDLPWNPQRVEQRIGRCHRYGQKHDVVVINFLNERNEADQRVYELLNEKFNLFSGVFGASDEVLGAIESGVDFEKRILAIYQQCRTSEEIQAAFAQLQVEMEEVIQSKIAESRRILLENFDEDVHSRLKFQLDSTKDQLDRMSKLFWSLSLFALDRAASFQEDDLSFDLLESPTDDIPLGRYHLITKNKDSVPSEYLYRLSHPLGQYALEKGKTTHCPFTSVVFDITHHPTKISVIEALKGRQGWLTLQRLVIDSFEREEYLLFSALDENGKPIAQETCEKLFYCQGSQQNLPYVEANHLDRLNQDASRHVEATISKSLEENNHFFREQCLRLEKWADDKVKALEKELNETKERIKALNRQARIATSTEEQYAIQEEIKDLERRKRRQRQTIFDQEDEIADKRDELIGQLEKKMKQKTSTEMLFTIHWQVV